MTERPQMFDGLTGKLLIGEISSASDPVKILH